MTRHSSPITPRLLAQERRVSDVFWDSCSRLLVWLESRGECQTLVCSALDGDAPRDLSTPFGIRAGVGYSGGDFNVHAGYAYAASAESGALMRINLAFPSDSIAITPAFGHCASPAISPDGKWALYVHHDANEVDRLAITPTSGGQWPQVIASGADFYMQPVWNLSGDRIAWIEWDHPNMPWDGARLVVASCEQEDGTAPRVINRVLISERDDVSAFGPKFLSGDRLLYVSDETGWWRLALHDLKTGSREWLTPEGMELAIPAWRQGMRTFTVTEDERTILAVGNQLGRDRLLAISLVSRETRELESLSDYGELSQPAAVGNLVAVIGSAPTSPARLVLAPLDAAKPRILARSTGETVSGDVLSMGATVAWKTAGGVECHGIWYPPAHGAKPNDGAPPAIVLIHGGPTSQVKLGWRGEAQFFATRGYGVLYVNHRGGTGYGRAYRELLNGNWGIVDVEDAVSGARFLVDSGRAAKDRLIIYGGSAGGFTVLQTMVDHPQSFAAGVALYPVANQFSLIADTHKFESRYSDRLIGPLPASAAAYRARSPVFHAKKIARPLALFQGALDRVVPKSQSDELAAEVRKNGTPFLYQVYDQEGHGWRRPDTLEHFYQTVERFLRENVLFT